MTRYIAVGSNSTVYVFTHAEMMEAIGISAWAGFQDAKERAIELTEAGGFPLSFFFEEEQAWEVIDTADENQYLRLSELQPYARCPPQFK